jgi:outer membrane protein OmpA-like peptidoglycan-associated protein
MSLRFLKTCLLVFALSTPALGVATAQTPPAMTLDVCPDSFSNFPADGPPLTCGCTAEAVKRGSVYGANPYMYQSNLCRAAVHAGAISPQGGQIVATPAKAPMFPAVTRNGVSSSSDSGGVGFQIVITGAPPAATSPAGMTLEVCPDSFSNFPADGPPLTCGCTAEAVKRGSVYGANPYMYQSNLCRAAVHAGAISPQGGQVVATPAKAPMFPAVTRNGVSSGSDSGGVGFQIVITGAPTVPPAATSAGMTLDVCPDSFSNFPADGPPLTCGCTAEAVKRGSVYGANPYMYQSNLCRAAVHAGAISSQGGQIVATPAKAPMFPAVTRNGVSSSSDSGGVGFQIAVSTPSPTPTLRAPPPAPAADARGRPIQAPIAETLKAVGKVQVYINFATASDRIEASSAPVLNELLATLRADPAMKVELVGHTDNQGGSTYNLDLSERRAASVYAWLGQRGVARERLRSSGRGFLEPLADNDTDRGRALNRRVEVKLAD